MTENPRQRVLVVDDDPDCAEELAELLECYGCTVIVANSVATARLAFADNHIDLAVIDLVLGAESGLVLAHEWFGRNDIRIVLLSGRTLTPSEKASFFGTPPQLLLKPASGADIINNSG